MKRKILIAAAIVLGIGSVFASSYSHKRLTSVFYRIGSGPCSSASIQCGSKQSSGDCLGLTNATYYTASGCGTQDLVNDYKTN